MILTLLCTCAVLLGAWVISGYVPTMNIEMPHYTVIETRPGYEVRRYDGYVVAETRQAGSREDALSSGFRVLFDYISGNNTARTKVKMTAPVIQSGQGGGEKIPMTAPVIKRGEGEASTIAFVMPPGKAPEELPVPGSPNVVLRRVPSHTMAAVRFSGYAPADRLAEYTEKLLEATARDGLELLAPPLIALYNPPWTPPFMRRNEIMVEIRWIGERREPGTE